MGDDSKADAKATALQIAADLAKQSYSDVQPIVQEAVKLLAFPLRFANSLWRNVDLAFADDEMRFAALKKAMASKWEKIPPHRLLSPPGNVVGPWLEGYTWVQDPENAPLRELYEQLLASAMDAEARPGVHPAFVEMLRQMTAREARMVRVLASSPGQQLPVVRLAVEKPETLGQVRIRDSGLAHPFEAEGESGVNVVTASLKNLERLGLVALDYERTLITSEVYEAIEARAKEHLNQRINSTADLQGWRPRLERGLIKSTHLGAAFISACIVEEEKSG